MAERRIGDSVVVGLMDSNGARVLRRTNLMQWLFGHGRNPGRAVHAFTANMGCWTLRRQTPPFALYWANVPARSLDPGS